MPVDGKELVEAVRGDMVTLLEGVGLSAQKLVASLADELNAEESKTYFDGKSGKWQYSKKFPLWPIRQKARQDAHRLSGHYLESDSGAPKIPLELNIFLGEDGKTVDGGQARVVPAGEIGEDRHEEGEEE